MVQLQIRRIVAQFQSICTHWDEGGERTRSFLHSKLALKKVQDSRPGQIETFPQNENVGYGITLLLKHSYHPEIDY